MTLKLLISVVFVGAAYRNSPVRWRRIGTAGATRGSSCMRPASRNLSRWPSSGGRDSGSLVPQVLPGLLGALATLIRHREAPSHFALSAVTLLLVLVHSSRSTVA